MPKEKNFILQLPDELVGKTIEVIAFEVETDQAKAIEPSKEERLKDIQSIFADCRVDLTNFKFNRDQANNYDE